MVCFALVLRPCFTMLCILSHPISILSHSLQVFSDSLVNILHPDISYVAGSFSFTQVYKLLAFIEARP